MAGLQADTPIPVALTLHQRSRQLELRYEHEKVLLIGFELMRVYSPSAEVQGHGPGQEVLQLDKQDVMIVSLEPVGHYAVRPVFSDGHQSGIFSWDYLYFLGSQQERLWQDYLLRLQAVHEDAPDASSSPKEGREEEMMNF